MVYQCQSWVCGSCLGKGVGLEEHESPKYIPKDLFLRYYTEDTKGSNSQHTPFLKKKWKSGKYHLK